MKLSLLAEVRGVICLVIATTYIDLEQYQINLRRGHAYSLKGFILEIFATYLQNPIAIFSQTFYLTASTNQE